MGQAYTISYTGTLRDGWTHGATVTNEDPLLLHGLVKGYIVPSALAIAGGGEAPILGLLPTVPRVHAVDGDKRSLAVTAVKAAMLQEYGAGIKRVIAAGPSSYQQQARERVLGTLPADLQELLAEDARWMENYGHFQRIWNAAGDEALEAARQNLRGLSLEHTLLQNASGTYPLIYASNAIGWYIESHKRLSIEDLIPLSMPRAAIISSIPFTGFPSGLWFDQVVKSEEERFGAPYGRLFVCRRGPQRSEEPPAPYEFDLSYAPAF